MPENTETFAIPKPLNTDKPPSIEDAVGPGLDRVDELLGEIAPGQIVGGSAGKLLIAGSTGAGAYKAMSGDATIDKDGALAIAKGAVGTAELADGAGTSPKLKPTIESAAQVGGPVTLSYGTWSDLATIMLTPSVTSALLIFPSIKLQVSATSFVVQWRVAEGESALMAGAETLGGLSGTQLFTITGSTYPITLTPGSHILKLQAMNGIPSGSEVKVEANITGLLFAQ